MLQTLQGYFQEGRFVSPQSASIPENVEVFVVVTEKTIQAQQTKVQQQRTAFNEFMESISGADPLGNEFDEIINQGINLQRELAL